jgi:hypothetical protein
MEAAEKAEESEEWRDFQKGKNMVKVEDRAPDLKVRETRIGDPNFILLRVGHDLRRL